jgi:hypothetical protein
VSPRAGSLTLALAAALVLPACGADDGGAGEGGATTAPGPDKAAVIARADAICAAASRKSGRALDRLADAAGGVRRIKVDSTAIGVMLQGDVLYLRRAIEEHRRLEPPPEGRAEFDEFLDREERLLAAFEKAEAAIAQGGPGALGEAGPELQDAGRETSRAAARYGLAKCPPVGSFMTFLDR